MSFAQSIFCEDCDESKKFAIVMMPHPLKNEPCFVAVREMAYKKQILRQFDQRKTPFLPP